MRARRAWRGHSKRADGVGAQGGFDIAAQRFKLAAEAQGGIAAERGPAGSIEAPADAVDIGGGERGGGNAEQGRGGGAGGLHEHVAGDERQGVVRLAGGGGQRLRHGLDHGAGGRTQGGGERGECLRGGPRGAWQPGGIDGRRPNGGHGLAQRERQAVQLFRLLGGEFAVAAHGARSHLFGRQLEHAEVGAHRLLDPGGGRFGRDGVGREGLGNHRPRCGNSGLHLAAPFALEIVGVFGEQLGRRRGRQDGLQAGELPLEVHQPIVEMAALGRVQAAVKVGVRGHGSIMVHPAAYDGGMLRAALLALSGDAPIGRHLRRWAEHSGWGRRLSGRFVAGLTLGDALAAVQQLNRQGLAASLDPLGEHVATRAAAAQAAEQAIAILDAIAAVRADATLSLKLSQLGLDVNSHGHDVDRDLAAAHLRRVLAAAARQGNVVCVDMEGSDYTAATLALVEQLHAEGLPVSTVVQAALRRTPADLERLLSQRIGVRLVKGAYREPAERAWQRKAAVDECYLRLMRRVLEAAPGLAAAPPGMTMGAATGVAIATHDERLIRAAVAYARQRGLAPAAFEFQLLYGIRRDLQRQLQAEGWRVRIYVPFGPAWYPYLMRRLAERPANLLFLLRNLGN